MTDSEHPDFLVTEGDRRFGLEVCEIFTGPQGRSGSGMREAESTTQKRIDGLRREYESAAAVPLRVQIVGNLSADNMAAVVPDLLALDFASKPTGHHVVIDQGRGLQLHVTKAFRSEWFSVNDRVGWVDRQPIRRIVEAIEKKSRYLPRYKVSAGDDVRLLIVADRINNSGKLKLEDGIAVDLRGFQTIYFFSRPESVVELRS